MNQEILTIYHKHLRDVIGNKIALIDLYEKIPLPQALWDEMKFDVKHCNDIERCAIVGDPSWHQWMTKMGQTIFRRAQMKYFDKSQSEEAWQWVCEGVESNHQTEPETTTASM